MRLKSLFKLNVFELMQIDFHKYKQDFTQEDIDLRGNKEVFSEVVFRDDIKEIIIFLDYPKFQNYLAILFYDQDKVDKYLFDLAKKQYQDYIIEILFYYRYGNSKLVQLAIFNKIQRAITHFYVDVKNFRYSFSEGSRNSLVYFLAISINTSKVIRICQIDEDALSGSLKQKVSKTAKKNLLSSCSRNFIYLMHNKKNGHYKIGFSKDPQYREKTLHSEEPDIHIYRKWLAPQKYEGILKKKYLDKKVRGEWYDLNAIELVEIDRIMSNFYNSLEEGLVGSISKILGSLLSVSSP